MWSKVGNWVGNVFNVGFRYFVLCQMTTVYCALVYWFEMNWMVSIPIALVATLIPLIGQYLVFLGAAYVLEWPWWLAFLFAIPNMFVFMGIVAICIVISKPNKNS